MFSTFSKRNLTSKDRFVFVTKFNEIEVIEQPDLSLDIEWPELGIHFVFRSNSICTEPGDINLLYLATLPRGLDVRNHRIEHEFIDDRSVDFGEVNLVSGKEKPRAKK